ncbi:STAM-binding protein-like isoform X2 [Cricetulus griseus]|uniref:STAM-binding protein-like isoform X2 n=1 Tax=Cricetulus griseus TaxID=10029 RepID=A0A9J7HG05_CRIGR|nr:STAM-binding protein-like isoform X2 [Cricetulus griseus]
MANGGWIGLILFGWLFIFLNSLVLQDLTPLEKNVCLRFEDRKLLEGQIGLQESFEELKKLFKEVHEKIVAPVLSIIILFVEKLRKGPEYQNSLSKGTRSKINKTINRVFEKAEILKSKLLEQYSKEFAEYLADKKKREEEEAEKKVFWQDVRNTIKNSPNFAKWSALLDRLVDGIGKDRSGETGPSLASTIKSAEESSAESTPQEAVEEITPKTSSDQHGVEPQMVESPGQNSEGLRPVVLPKDLCDQFLRSARKNTKKGIETCGVLCGALVKEAYHVTHVIIPVQKGGPDYCYAQNEEELFFKQEELGLLTLGWIHTHPTQTAFLSSVDIHTHFCYQKMLPESIAVVCSPKYKQTGIFTLTSYGLKEISCCPKRGFHPHKQDSALFCDCSHVTIQKSRVTITDLR